MSLHLWSLPLPPKHNLRETGSTYRHAKRWPHNPMQNHLKGNSAEGSTFWLEHVVLCCAVSMLFNQGLYTNKSYTSYLKRRRIRHDLSTRPLEVLHSSSPLTSTHRNTRPSSRLDQPTCKKVTADGCLLIYVNSTPSKHPGYNWVFVRSRINDYAICATRPYPLFRQGFIYSSRKNWGPQVEDRKNTIRSKRSKRLCIYSYLCSSAQGPKHKTEQRGSTHRLDQKQRPRGIRVVLYEYPLWLGIRREPFKVDDFVLHGHTCHFRRVYIPTTRFSLRIKKVEETSMWSMACVLDPPRTLLGGAKHKGRLQIRAGALSWALKRKTAGYSYEVYKYPGWIGYL